MIGLNGCLGLELSYCCTAPNLVSYWQSRYGWSDAQACTVDVLGTKGAAAKLRLASVCRIQKLRCGWLPVNNRVARHDPDRLPGCSACSTSGLVEETVDHIFQCTSSARRHTLLDRFTHFHSHFREMKTANHLISALQTGALAWVEGNDPHSVHSLCLPENLLGRLITKAYLERSSLG